MDIGKRIRELREEKGINQKKLAQEIGVAQSAISQWESGVNEPKASYVLYLAEYFDVTADYLLGREE